MIHLALILALSGMAAQGPSVTEQYFEAFDRLCLANRGAPSAVLAAAEAEGWRPGPDSMAEPYRNPRAPEVHVWLPPEGSPWDHLLLSSSPREAGRAQAHACSVQPQEEAGVDRELLYDLVRARVGSDPNSAQPMTWLLVGDEVLSPAPLEMLQRERDRIFSGTYDSPIYLLTVFPETDLPSAGMIRMGP